MGGLLTDFAQAWQLLTAIRLPPALIDQQRPPGRAIPYFPLVGLVLGVLLAGTGELLFWGLPAGIASALLLVTWVAFTGMLHLDGFMDCCDGLLPPRDSVRRLEIMRDSRVGAFGVVGAILLLLIKFSGLLALSAPQRWLVLLVVPMLGRWAMSWAMVRYPRARSDGMGEYFSRGLKNWQVVAASLLVGGITLLVLWPGGVLLWGSAWLTMTLIVRFAIARVGGLTGDVYGATCELTEAALLVVAVILW